MSACEEALGVAAPWSAVGSEAFGFGVGAVSSCDLRVSRDEGGVGFCRVDGDADFALWLVAVAPAQLGPAAGIGLVGGDEGAAFGFAVVVGTDGAGGGEEEVERLDLVGVGLSPLCSANALSSAGVVIVIRASAGRSANGRGTGSLV